LNDFASTTIFFLISLFLALLASIFFGVIKFSTKRNDDS
jgi:hypothetical protein